MQDLIGSVRRSLAFKPSGEETSGFGGFVEKIESSIRKSRIGLFNKPPVHALPPIPKAEMPPPRKYMKEEYPMPMMEDEALPPMEEAMEEEAPLKIKKEEMVPLARVAKENDKEKEAVGTSGAVKRKESSIRWRKGEMIGCGAFGRVYMGMNLDSGELLAVKEVAIGANSASKKAQDQLLELEKEVNLLKNLSHPNIVRYLGTAREEDSLHILLEFVPGGSISSLLGKFGSFPESVIRMYTKQLLLGLEYLHKYKIMHRDIKGANILVDNKGCIKLADFGASKKVEALATVTGAKSMKGTPYWMAPEVIVQSGHSYSADIWSVGCTVIEMATGKAPWSQQYQEVAALFYIGTTKSHPPIPEHLSAEAQDFLLKCLQKEPDLRPTASDLSKHPFVTGERQESRLLCRPSPVGSSGKRMAALGVDLEKSMNVETKMTYNSLKDVNVADGVRCSTVYPNQLSESQSFWQPVNSDDDMCLIDDSDDLVFGTPAKSTSTLLSRDYNQSFNPMCEPSDHGPCKFDESPELKRSGNELLSSQIIETGNRSHVSGDVDCGFTFPRGPASEDEDEATESRIREFLDEKALELKKLQTPLYEEFYNSLNVAGPLSPVGKENISNNSNLPPKSRSPSRMVSRRFSTALDVENRPSPSSCSRRVSNIGDTNYRASPDKELESQHDPLTPRASFFEREKKWKEELVEELERKRELMRQAGAAKTSSPNDRIVNRHKDRLWFASP